MLGVLISALALAACGRKGPLDLPPLETTQQPGGAQAADGRQAAPASRPAPPVEYNIDNRPLAPRGEKKKLPADVLID
jgi:predicted small lipoprotein YifL